MRRVLYLVEVGDENEIDAVKATLAEITREFSDLVKFKFLVVSDRIKMIKLADEESSG